MDKTRRPNPMAKDLMNPKYRPKVIPDKKRPAIRKKKQGLEIGRAHV